MATYGPNSPGTTSGAGGSGSVSWTNPGNIVSSNNSRATVTLDSDSDQASSRGLDATNFSFAITDGESIVGIQVDVEGSISSDAVAPDCLVQLLKAGTPVGTEFSIGLDGTEAYHTVGGASSLWGTTWTESDIEASTFGARIRLTQEIGGAGTQTSGSIDHVRITIYTTAGAVTGTLSKTLDSVAKSMAGQVAISGSFNKSLASVTKSMAGAVAIAGTSSKTLSAVTAVSAGQVALSGSLAKTLASLDKSMAGTVSVSGILDEALEALASSGAGMVAVSGGTTYTLGGLTLSSAGSVIVVANLVSTLETISGSKLGAVEVQAIVNKTLESLSLVGAGGVEIVAVTDATLGTIILVSAGGETGSITGSLQQVLGGLAGTLNGAVSIMGDLDVTLGGTVTVVRPGVILLEDGRMAVRAGSVYIIL